MPLEGGDWTSSAAAQARTVARMRERGHTLREIRAAVRDGRLAFGSIEDLIPPAPRTIPLTDAAAEAGLEAALAQRIMGLLGTPLARAEKVSQADAEALEVIAGILDDGFPLVAVLQLVRVYAQSIRRIAEAEVRLFHLFVHEPLMRDGAAPLEIAEHMEGLADALMPSVTPLMEYIHTRYLRFFMEQDVVGHMESELLSLEQPDRLEMAFCFVDLTGFTRFTAEAGDEQALDKIERFVETVEATLPREATLVKTIGDEVMVVSTDPTSLTEWAVDLLRKFPARPRPRAAVHRGSAVYREGDYFGGDVNLTHRVVARANAGEVLVTRAVVDGIGSSDRLAFETIGPVELPGLPSRAELFRAGASGAG